MIETLDDWNERLGQCGCCLMPECPAPIIVCQSVSATANACGGSPPSGWESTCSAPIAEPAGEPTDPLPAIYRAKRFNYTMFEGSWGYLLEGSEIRREDFADDTASGYVNEFVASTISPFEATGERYLATSNYVDFGDIGVFVLQDTSTETTEQSPFYYMPEWDEPGLPPTECTATTRRAYDFYGVKNEGTRPERPGLPVYYHPTEEDWDVETFWADNAKVSHGSFLDLSDPITKDELLSEAIAELPEGWSGSGTSCAAKLETTWPEIQDFYEAGDPEPVWPSCEYGYFPLPASATATARKVRFRFRIPDTHTGSKYYITYDIAEFPDDGDPSLVSEDNVIEWTGPGTGSSSDPSWLTDWVVIEPPEVSGERRIVNVRYTCYSGAKYGAKPQLVGEAFP